MFGAKHNHCNYKLPAAKDTPSVILHKNGPINSQAWVEGELQRASGYTAGHFLLMDSGEIIAFTSIPTNNPIRLQG